jgi:hypothetical protein
MPRYDWMLIGLLLINILLINISLPADAADDKFPTAKRAIVEQRHDELKHYSLQAGTILLATNQTPLSTQYNQVGDPVEVRLMKDVWIEESIVLTKSTRLFGSVSVVEPPLYGRDAILSVRFYEAELENGERVPIVAKVVTPNKKDTFGGDVTEPTQYKLVRYEVWGLGMYNRAWKTGERALGKQTELKVGEIFRVGLEAPMELVLPMRAE